MLRLPASELPRLSEGLRREALVTQHQRTPLGASPQPVRGAAEE